MLDQQEGFLSLQTECTDVATSEQIAIRIQFVDTSDKSYQVVEECTGFSELENVNAVSIIDYLNKCNLDLSNLGVKVTMVPVS